MTESYFFKKSYDHKQYVREIFSKFVVKLCPVANTMFTASEIEIALAYFRIVLTHYNQTQRLFYERNLHYCYTKT